MNRTITGKEGILSELEKRVKEQILERSNYDLLKKLIEKADTLDEAIKIAELGTTYKRTGFHFDKRLEKQSDTITYFKKNEALSFVTDPQAITHKLIIGDNYPALLNLLIEYKGRINVIYIDPPYGKDSMGEFAETNYDNAITRDNLLSMLYPRLMLARQLLSDDGVIFCSIDDKNQAYVKCLFDEVFEERNFIANIIVNRTSEIATDKTIQKHEYCLLYSKENSSTTLCGDKRYTTSRGTVGNSDQTMPIITFPKGLRCLNIPDGTYTQSRQIPDSRENIEIITPFVVKNGVLAQDVQLKARWRSSNDMRRFFGNNCQPTKAKINGFIEEIYFDGDRMMPYIIKNITEKISTLYLDNNRGSKFVEDLNIPFDFPKSVDFIKYITKLFVDQGGIVLDFFFGSGTTGQAVLEMGDRIQFIGVQLDEDLDDALNKAAKKTTIKSQIDFCNKIGRPHKLSEITCERLRRVMTGRCYDGSNDFEWIKKNKPYGGNLDVYELGEVSNFEHVNGKTAFDVIDERLYGQKQFKTVREKIEWVCNNFETTQKRVEK